MAKKPSSDRKEPQGERPIDRDMMARTWRHAVRLTFRYEGSTIQLQSSQRVDMIVPPSNLDAVQKEHSGFWVELQVGEERAVYRRVSASPIALDHEVFSPEGDDGPSIQRVKSDTPRGVFQILVPDIPDAREVVLYSSPLEAEGRPAREVFRANLDRQHPGSDKES